MLKINEIVDDNFKKEMNVLDDNETRRERIWKDCVDEAKKIISLTKELRLQIVTLAEKACVIHHGGRASNSRFTVVRFANEIGINHKTLQEWMSLKRSIYDILPENEQKKVSFTDMKYLDSQTKSGKRNTLEKSKAVLAKLTEMRKQHPDTVKFIKYKAHLKTLLFNAKNKAMTKHCDRAVLADVLHLSREISKHLNWVDFEVKEKVTP